MNVDPTAGKPEKVLWKFCLPLFGSILFQQLYNIADSFVAGHYIGWIVGAVLSVYYYKKSVKATETAQSPAAY